MCAVDAERANDGGRCRRHRGNATQAGWAAGAGNGGWCWCWGDEELNKAAADSQSTPTCMMLLCLVGFADFTRSTHTHLTALFLGLPGWAGSRKVKPIWILLKQDTVSGSGISWDITQVCNLLQTDNHDSTPSLSFLQAGCPSCRPTNSIKALKAQIPDNQMPMQNRAGVVRGDQILWVYNVYDVDAAATATHCLLLQ